MAESSWKRFWSSISTPAPIERMPVKQPSALGRFWDAIKPPPAVKGPDEGLSKAEKRRRWRLVLATMAVAVAAVLAWQVYLFIASAPMRAEKVLQDGMGRMGAGDYVGAIERFNKAVGIWPRLAAGYLERGLAHRNMNQEDAAIADFERAVQEDSNLGPAHTALGEVYRERGDLTRAIAEFTLAINLNPSTDAYYQRGQVYNSQGQHQMAIQDYDLAIHEQPDAPYVYRARALAREALGDAQGGRQDRATAIRIERPH
jgi:tetratricopeptide (TPR) repeat protein